MGDGAAVGNQASLAWSFKEALLFLLDGDVKKKILAGMGSL